MKQLLKIILGVVVVLVLGIRSCYVNVTATKVSPVKELFAKDFKIWPFKERKVTLQCKMEKVNTIGATDNDGKYWLLMETGIKTYDDHFSTLYFRKTGNIFVMEPNKDLSSSLDADMAYRFRPTDKAIDALISEYIKTQSQEYERKRQGYLPDKSINWSKFSEIDKYVSEYSDRFEIAHDIAAGLCIQEVMSNEDFKGIEPHPEFQLHSGLNWRAANLKTP